jgi:ABC-type multidrug transport system ATPase subunit
MASASIRKKTGFSCDFCGHAWDAPAIEFSDAYYRGLADLEVSLVAPGGDRFLLHSFPTVLGRDSEFKALQQNLAISRRHFQIDVAGESLKVTDFGSRGGTYLNGKQTPANQPQIINAGDSLRVSGVELRVEIRLRGSPADKLDHRPGPDVISLNTGAEKLTVGGLRSNADIRLALPEEAAIAACFFRGTTQSLWQALAIQSGGIIINGRFFLEHHLAAGDEISIGPFRYVYQAGESRLRPRQPSHGMGLSARGIVFSVNTRHGSKRILNDVAVDIPAGRLTAIIGASGSGKTTLVKILSGVLRADNGEIHVNEQAVALGSLCETMAGKVGFVPQDDIVHAELSVHETMDFAASLRLARDIGSSERQDIVGRVLRDLDLHEHLDKLVSQLSGGQRKRLNVAVELASSPLLLFLDEPTTGLDTGSERELVQCLRRLAYQGRTIVLITHSLAILDSVDHVVFMADDGTGGRVLVQGGAQEAKQQHNFENWKDLFERGRSGSQTRFTHQVRTRNALSRFSFGLPPAAALFLRYVNVWIATPATTAFTLVLLPFLLGLLTRLALPMDGQTGTDRMLFGVICALWLGMNQTVREIVKEKNIMLRESFAGVGCASYLFSKLAFFLLIGALQSIALTAPMVWLRVNGVSVSLSLTDMACPAVILWLTFWLALAVGSSVGFLISAIGLYLRSKGEVVAVLLVVLVMLPQILFSEKVLGNLAEKAVDYRAFVITDQTRAAAEIASYLTASRYLYLPLAAISRSKAELSSIFTFNITILLGLVLSCTVLTWVALEVFVFRQKKATHW